MNSIKSPAALVGAANRLAALTGGKVFATCIFDHPTGWYYDPVGDELFFAKRIGLSPQGPIYSVDFGDEKKVGVILDHGLHERIEE